MHPIHQKIKEEITEDLNKLMNNFTIHQEDLYLDHEIIAIISNYLSDFYASNYKIYEYLVKCNYPNLEIYIKYSKGSEIDTIELQRFQRIKKLKILNNI